MRADADILAKFVMRRRGALPATLDEAKTHRDVVLVDAPASLPSKTAPLTTLLLWLECAASAWPNAQLVGKADDDVWVRAPLVAAHLRGSLAALASRTRGAPPRLYWGMFETMHWDDAVLRPAQAFSYGFGRSEACRRMVAPPSYAWRSYYNWTNKGGVVIHVLPTRMSREPLVPSAAPWPSHRRHGATNGSADAFIGPYPFAKGPLYFLDASARRPARRRPPLGAPRAHRPPFGQRLTAGAHLAVGGHLHRPRPRRLATGRGSRRSTSAAPPSSSPSPTLTAATAS